jgi:hypothetical protein
MNGLSVKGITFLLIALVFFSSVYICFSPLIPSIDSIEGFLTYKQALLHSSTLNFRPDVSPANVNVDYFRFTGYWSPGQWLYPGALNFLLHIKLGAAAIIVTIVCLVTGMIGFYRLFRYLNFNVDTCLYSLLLIFCSYTFYYSLIVYQGGEILSFGIFPWFIYFVLSTEKPSLKNLAIIAGLLLLCFLAKFTLLIYCPIVITFKIVEPAIRKYLMGEKSFRINANGLLYALPIAVMCGLVYYFFVSKYPLLHGHFDPSALDLLTPLSSPLLSILSLHQIIGRISLNASNFSLEVMYFILFAVFVFVGYMIVRSEKISPLYKSFLSSLYIGVCLFFIFCYLFNRVDQSPRHFKFLGYMFLPGILTVAGTYLSRSKLQLVVLLICLLSTAAFIYLKQDWTKHRFVSTNYFYRNYDNKDNVDRLDKESYKKLLVIAKDAPRSAVFFIQANLDIEMDIPFRCIIPWHNLDQKYFGHGPVIFACLPQDTLSQYPNLLTQKFPGYRSFHLLDRTKTFAFYKCE